MKWYRVNIFYSTFIPYTLLAGSRRQALRKAREIAASRGVSRAERGDFLRHLERLSEKDEVGLTDAGP